MEKEQKIVRSKKLLDYHNIFEPDVVLAYKGPFNKNILNGMGNYIKEILVDSPQLSFKVFSIFVELAQNIYFYSSVLPEYKNKSSNFGTFIIEQFPKYYTISAGNIVHDEDVEPIIEKCDIINSLERDDLRKYKKEQRKQARSSKGGANIGLIQVALTSSNQLDIEVAQLKDGFSFFTISTNIDK